MRYPKLVQKNMCRTPIHIIIHDEGLGEDGGPKIIFEDDNLYCNYQDTAKTVLTADKKLVQLSGAALFHEDFCPELPTLGGGTAVVNGVKRAIFQGTKARNPDGTVNYVELRFV